MGPKLRVSWRLHCLAGHVEGRTVMQGHLVPLQFESRFLPQKVLNEPHADLCFVDTAGPVGRSGYERCPIENV